MMAVKQPAVQDRDEAKSAITSAAEIRKKVCERAWFPGNGLHSIQNVPPQVAIKDGFHESYVHDVPSSNWFGWINRASAN